MLKIGCMYRVERIASNAQLLTQTVLHGQKHFSGDNNSKKEILQHIVSKWVQGDTGRAQCMCLDS